MDKVAVELKNCYGIKELTHGFDFTKSSWYAIYAPNGAMKSSLAKTFKDLSTGAKTGDVIFPNRASVRNVIVETGKELDPTSVFVIEPYSSYFKSEKVSSLLVNSQLKAEYDAQYSAIDKAKTQLLKQLSVSSGLKATDVEYTMVLDLAGKEAKFLDVLELVEDQVGKDASPGTPVPSYKEVFNDKVVSILKDPGFQESRVEYLTKYNSLLDSSKYFKKGIFTHDNAASVGSDLENNGFFKAGHALLLKAGEDSLEINTQADLEKLIQEEREKILGNPERVQAFEGINKKLSANKELRDFRQYLTDNPDVVKDLGDPETLKRSLWIAYLGISETEYISLLTQYHSAKSEIEKIIEKARKETTQWQEVIDIFHKRFTVPFRMTIGNQEDAVLNMDAPAVKFHFTEKTEVADVDEQVLLGVLSRGELRALYLLNIIFEITARSAAHHDTLLVVDDIADSFDYKNKYAILEYLHDICENPKFKQIILTHNFDFFRTVRSRFPGGDKSCLMIEKNVSRVDLLAATYIDPFNSWLNPLNRKGLIACIPFVRNLIEYANGSSDADYIKLTSLLHIKSDSSTITKQDLDRIYSRIIPKRNDVTLLASNENILGLIYTAADACQLEPEINNLENKIILAMAIRLKTEEYIFSKVTDKSEPTRNQTRELSRRFKKEFGNTMIAEQDIIDRVNLMTPENIHINSFMYEPLLDMSEVELKNLYTDVSKLK